MQLKKRLRIAVLASKKAWHFLDFQRAASPRHDVICNPYNELAAGVSDQPTFSLVADCVVVRTMPAGSLQQIVFRMDLLARLAQSGVLVLNSPKSIEAAVDKYLSLALLREHEILIPATLVSQDLATALEHFDQLGGNVVVKPLFGSMGNGIVRLQSRTDAESCFRENIQTGNVIYQQEFIHHDGFDIRLLVIGDQVFGMKRKNGTNWITNISQGGRGEPYLPSDDEKKLAIRAARAVGAHFAGVDLIKESASGRKLIMEVNAVPGWQAISRVLDTDIAALLIGEIERLWSNSDRAK